MATVARHFGLKNVGETLLSSKLQILNGSGNRRPSVALSILTGRVASQLSILETFYPEDPVVLHPVAHPAVETLAERSRPQYTARTVYLTETHLRDIDFIVDALTKPRSNQLIKPESKRVTRSAVVRRALEQLRAALEADADESFEPLEND
jgi:hypothetical protein